MVTHPGFGIITQETDQHQEEIQNGEAVMTSQLQLVGKGMAKPLSCSGKNLKEMGLLITKSSMRICMLSGQLDRNPVIFPIPLVQVWKRVHLVFRISTKKMNSNTMARKIVEKST